ncbi:MAG: DNA polymerase I [Patescibacteria group bacterium]
MSKAKPKLIIIDGNAIIHRSFHALPPTLKTKDGVLVNAVYGFTSFLLKSLNEFHPEYVILTLDKAGKTFRHEAYAEYKATRVKAPDELYEQIPLVKRIAEVFDIPIFEKTGFEADDLIGTLCKQAEKEKNLETIIMTGDMDTLQLVSDKTKVYTMSRGLSDSVLYDADKIKERYNLTPEQIIDYKALRGDPSDNIPGVRGIGEKTAVELLVDFKDLDGVYKAAEKNDKKIKPRTIELLMTSRENAFLSKELATINCEAPIELSLEKARFATFNLEDVLNIFSEFDFRSLLNKVKEVRDRLEKAHQGGETGAEVIEQKIDKRRREASYTFIKTEAEFESFCLKINKAKEFSFKTEASSNDPMTAEIIGLSFCLEEGEAYFISNEKDWLEKLKPVLENENVKKIGHNLKFDWHLLKNKNIELKGIYFDVMLASYLINPGERHHDLDALAFSELGIEKITAKNIQAEEPKQLSLDLSGPDPEKLSLFACENVDLIKQLEKILSEKLKELELTDVFNKIEMPLISVLADMEHNGIKIDIIPLNNLDKEVKIKIKKLGQEIHKLAGTDFNINSTKQLKEILFTDLEISTAGIKKTKTGFSTAEEELAKLKDLHPIISFLQEYRELNKLETTYLNALPKMINKHTGKIHTNFNQTIAATGRLSSNEPNLQNIPTRTEEGRRIREAFIADKGYKLVGFDYSQIELRLAAHMSKDAKMMAAFKSNEDIHTATAAGINGVKLEEVTKEMRREAKAVNFGILYGQGPHGLSQGAGISYSEASQFIKKYFETYPGIKKMIDGFIKQAREKGYAITMFGRRRPLPDMESSIPFVKKSAERMAINTPVQGSAADLIKMAMIKISEMIKDDSENIRMLLQVHDELIFEIKEDKIEYYLPILKELMQNGVELKVPITVDEHTGNNWGELK